VITVTPHAAPAAENPVDGLRKADGEPLEGARERAVLCNLDEEMDVIALHGELQDAEAAARSRGETASNGREDTVPAQRGQSALRAEGDMGRVTGVVRRPAPVRDTDSVAGGLAAGTGATPAPRARAELELDGTACHLDWGRYSRILACCQGHYRMTNGASLERQAVACFAAGASTISGNAIAVGRECLQNG